MKPQSLNDVNAFTGEEIEIIYNESKQRTREWLEDRKGCFTGSNGLKLMGCGRSTAKQPWGSLSKLVDFGATAEKYVYNVGKERKTGILSMETTAERLEHGKEMEPLLIEQLIKDGIITDFKEKGFERFYEFGGASVDGLANYKGREVCLEMKSTTSWDGHYKRMYDEVVDEKHDDFWQIQTELLSVEKLECLYIVAAPMQVKVYDYQIVKASPIHQQELVKRCKIADKAIEYENEN